MVMLEKDENILKYNQGKNSLKAPFIISAYKELLLEKVYACENNSEKSFKTKISKQTVCGIH